MIRSFGHDLSKDLFYDRDSSAVRKFPTDLKRVARRKILYLHDAGDLNDLKVPPGNRLEMLKGNLKGLYSIRINDQWRVVFRWQGSDAFEVKVVDYHR